MDHGQHIHVDEALLAKYLAGEATPEEAIAVDDWLEASGAHRETFRQVARLWGREAYRAPDARAAWERFAVSRPPRYLYGWWAAAASVLLCAVLAYLLLPRPRETATVIAAAASIVRDTLPDRTVVVLPPGGRLTFEERFTPRSVQMEGEAYFEVAPDGNSPFTVQADELLVRVLGTSFNVEVTPAWVQVKVNSGTVQVSAGADSSVVKAGEAYTYHRGSRQTEVVPIAGAGKNGYAYATRRLVFEDAPLSRVIAEISKAYNVNIRLADAAAADCRISTVFDGKPLEYVLDVLTASLNLQYDIKGNDINIRGNGCR